MSTPAGKHVTKIGGGYKVTRDDDSTLTVFPREFAGGQWAVYFGSATVDDRHPYGGMLGSASPSAEQAIEWALR